ncbi:hypothetical protein L9F63_011415, partial [Diploptera punctata]
MRDTSHSTSLKKSNNCSSTGSDFALTTGKKCDHRTPPQFSSLFLHPSRFFHFPTVDDCNATLNSPIVICCCIFSVILTNDISTEFECESS